MKYDILIIGFGKGGKTLAVNAAKLGRKVALIEKSQDMYGGTCINIGCIPSKKLIMKSKEAKFFEDKNIFFKNVMMEKNLLTTALRAKNYAMLNDLENVDVIDGFASFYDENSISVTKKDGSVEKLRAENIIINTGSVDILPTFNINSKICYNSTQILSLNELPKRLCVLGGGYIALEFASMFANLGSKVTIITRGEQFMPKEDDDVAKSLKESLNAQGVEFIFGASINSLDDKILSFKHLGEQKNIESDAFLYAFGRKAAIDGLELHKAGVQTDDRKNILVNERLQSSTNGIYAIGDVKGGAQFTYISLDDYRIVFSQLFGDKSRTTLNRSSYATTLFTDTPLAKVGMSEKDALKSGKDFKVLKLELSSVPMAKVLGRDRGFMKVIVDRGNDEILGATMFCVEAGEIINLFSVAIQAKIKASTFKSQIFNHPSISEALNDLFGQL